MSLYLAFIYILHLHYSESKYLVSRMQMITIYFWPKIMLIPHVQFSPSGVMQ